jgi:hypothetical protein
MSTRKARVRTAMSTPQAQQVVLALLRGDSTAERQTVRSGNRTYRFAYVSHRDGKQHKQSR